MSPVPKSVKTQAVATLMVLVMALLSMLCPVQDPASAGGTSEEDCTDFVIFDANGGSPCLQQRVFDAQGMVEGLPAVYRDGYTFDGWWTDPAEGCRIGADDVFTQTMTVYAHWTPISVCGVQISTSQAQVNLGGSILLKASVIPFNALDRNIFWISSNPYVASVDADGNVAGRSLGSAVITVVTEDGHFAGTVAITVVPGAHTITFDANGGVPEEATGITEVSGKLVLLPSAERPDYTFTGWFTDAEGGMEITQDAVFLRDFTVYAHWTLTDRIVLDDPDITLFVDVKQHKVDATVFSEWATEDDVRWTVADGSVQIVTNNGTVIPIAPGTTTVTAYFGDVRAYCKVTVKESVTKVVPKIDETYEVPAIEDPDEVVAELDALQQETKTPYLNISSESADGVLLSADVIEALIAAGGIFDVSSSCGYLFIDDESVSALRMDGGDITLLIGSGSTDRVLNTAAVVDFAILNGGSEVPMQFPANVELGIRYDLDPQDLDMYSVFYIPDSGEPVKMDIAGYEDGYVYFYTNHFSTYALVYEGSENTADGGTSPILTVAVILIAIVAAAGVLAYRRHAA